MEKADPDWKKYKLTAEEFFMVKRNVAKFKDKLKKHNPVVKKLTSLGKEIDEYRSGN